MNERAITVSWVLWYMGGVAFTALFMFVVMPSRADAAVCCVNREAVPDGFRNECRSVDNEAACVGIAFEMDCDKVQGCPQEAAPGELGCCVNNALGRPNQCTPEVRANDCPGETVFNQRSCNTIEGCPQAGFVGPELPPDWKPPERLGCTKGVPCLWEGIEQCLGDQPRTRDADGKLTDEVCGVCEIFQLVVNAMRMLFAFIGGLALLMVFWGGFLWLKSRGSEEAVEAGKKTMVGALLGIVIVLGAWTLVNFVVISLTGKQTQGVGEIFGKPWNIIEFCKDKTPPAE